MKVLMLSTDRLFFVPGSEVRERLARRAEEYDSLDIIVFARRSLGYQPFSLSPSARVIPTNSKAAWSYLIDAYRLGKSLASPDLVTAQDPFETGLVGAWLARFHRAKLQLQIHTDFLNPYFRRQSWKNKLRLRLASYLLPRADLIRVVSGRIAASLKNTSWTLKAPITIEPVKIDLEKIKTAPIKLNLHEKYPQYEKIILMASRLTWEKNINLAIEALALVRERLPRVGLVLVGSGPEEPTIKRKVSQLGLKDQVQFEAWTQEISSYYKTADLFLNTSYYEGYGRTLLEAQVCGVPVISTDVGIAREAGFTLTPFEPNVLADLILKKIN